MHKILYLALCCTIGSAQAQTITSFIHTIDIYMGEIDTLLQVQEHYEAPNWHPDDYLILNKKGKLYTLEVATRRVKELDTDFANQNNNDHGLSPDGKWLAISHHDKNHPSPKSYKPSIYILPVEGGVPRQVTTDVPSYWHGWSPDGKTLAYCAERNGNFDIYTISIEGGEETRLTHTEGLDDGPEYTPDGKYIYFNSYRTGHMHIWRMLADGSQPEQITFDQNSNWFPHISPDNQWIVYLAYLSDEKQDHLFGKTVQLRLINRSTGENTALTQPFFGGQGTINVPSWRKDSRKLAFVSYKVD